MKCAACGVEKDATKTTKGSERLPRNWKRRGEETFCRACWTQQYRLRAIALPVLGPIGATWDELGLALREAWSEQTRAANYIASELALEEPEIGPDTEKLGKAPNPYLYPRVREMFPAIDSRSVAALCQAIAGKYNKARFDYLWRRARSLPNFRYPMPTTTHNAGWKLMRDDENRLVLRTRIGGRSWDIQLAAGKRYHRQVAAAELIISGEATQGELSFYQRTSDGNGGRGHVVDSATGSNARRKKITMCKLVAWLPSPPPKKRQREMTLATGAKSFWLATLPGRSDPWILHADHVREWYRAHFERLRRFSDDSKYEKRWPRKQRCRINDARELRCRKFNDRIKTFIQQAVASLVGFAVRQNVGKITYDDSERSYMGSFPWAALRDRLEIKCSEEGIQLEIGAASAEVMEAVRGPLEE